MSTETDSKDKSKLGKLPPDKRDELVQGLLCGWTYAQAAEWLKVECGERVSGSAWTGFHRRYVEPILQERKRFAALSAKALGKLASETQAFEQAAIAEMMEFGYRLIRDPETDPEQARKWMETIIKAQAGQRDARKLAMLEAKMKEAVTTANDTKLTPEEQTRRLREILK